MRVLSLWQPWATLIALKAKRIETRSWQTNYRGPIAIHAAKAFPKNGKDLIRGDYHFQAPLRDRFDLDGSPSQLIAALPLGKIVAVADLTYCFPTEWIDRHGLARLPGPRMDVVIAPITGPEFAFGDYGPGRYGWVLDNIRALREPLPYRGVQGLRTLDPVTEQKVRELLCPAA